MKQRILILDDERSICLSLSLALRRDYEVDTAQTAAEGLEKLASGAFHLVLLDLMIGEDDGIQVLRQIKSLDRSIAVIVITAFGSVRSSVEAMKQGAFTYLTKPVDLEELRIYIRQALEYRELNDRIAHLTSELDTKYEHYGMQGNSAAMQQVYGLISKVKNADASVVITGESGTGKELVARAIHFSGPRKAGKFVEINCAAIPEGLLEDEFFGHRKGAFTGALRDTVGKFALADGGTLFLDEIGDMPLSLQGKLLRALQEQEITPIGSNEVIRVDVRVLAATNRNLLELVERGEFRADLYYRLHVMEIRMPPLRERKEDIALLCGYYLREYAAARQLPPFEMDSEALETLLRYDFPGNVRQLFNILEYAALVCENRQIRSRDLPEEVLRASAPVRQEAAAPPPRLEDQLAGMPLRELERIAILATLEKNGGRRAATARDLGISERSLRYKIQEYGVEQQ